MQEPSIMKPVLILSGLAVLLAAMHFAASFFVPILLGTFMAMLLTPIYRWLKLRHVPGGLALLLTAGFMVLVALFLLLLAGTSIITLSAGLQSYADLFSQRQAELAARTNNFSQTVDFSPLLSTINPAALVSVLGFFLGMVAGLLKRGVIILMVTMFVLAEGPLFFAHMRAAFGSEHFMPKNLTRLAEMMISYFGLRALVNLITAVVTGLVLWFLGIEYAGLWAVLLFFLSFVPYVGAFFAMIPPVLLGYAQSGLGLAILIILLAVVINSIAENIVTPMVMGKGLSISPTVIFISFIFWMFILGGPGAFLAMPLTMALILFMRSFEETRGFAAMLITSREPAVQNQPLKPRLIEE